MKFIKVTNLMTIFGNADYKGLNIDLFISGSQAYSKDMSVFIGATAEENPPTHDDITEITEAQYLEIKDEFKSESPASDIETLKAENVALRNDLSNAVIELSTLIAMGGM